MKTSGKTPSDARWPRYFAAILAAAVGWAVYRPELVRPFDILDFGEFLPFLKRTNNFSEQVLSLVRYSAEQSGRVNLVQIVATTVKWNAFGSWTPGWQLASAAVMFVVILQTYRLALRLGATQLGGIVAASIFLVAPAAARGWVRLTMGEPIGMVAVLALTLRLFDFQQATKWGRKVVLFCGVTIFVILTKELMTPAMAMPLAVALAHRGDGHFSLPTMSRRNVVLVAAAALASLAALLPLALLYLDASTSALAAPYGAGIKSVASILAIWIATLVPFPLVSNPPTVVWTLSFVAFALVVAVGWRCGWCDGPERHRARWVLGGILLYSLIGALAYAPWPAYEERYAFPYIVATALLMGLGVSYLQRSSRRAGWSAAFGASAVTLFAATGAAAHAARADAVQRTADRVIQLVFEQQHKDSVFVATAGAAVPAWTGLGPTLFRLAAATDRPWPPTRDIRCSEVVALNTTLERVTIINFSSLCGGGTASNRHVVGRFHRVDWSRWRIVDDSIRADVFEGAASVVPKSRPAS